MSEPTAESAKIQSLEGLRGIMAWWVVLGHISLTFGWHLPLIDRNSLAVDVFILLSGFVIARLIDRKAEPYGQYITRRALRIFPLYLVALMASTLLLPVQLWAWTTVPFATTSNASRITLARQALDNLPAHLGVHLPLIQGLLPPTIVPGAAYTLIGQAWSVSLEWQFYLLAPFFVWALLARRRWPLLIVAVAVLCYTARYFPNAYLGARILHFCIGICCYFAVSRPVERRNWVIIVAGLTLAAVAIGGTWQIIPLAIWAAVLISSAAARGVLRWPADLLGTKLAVHFGAISYSIYLVHMIPLYCSLFVLLRIPMTQRLLQIGVLLATLLGTYLIARIMFAVVEKPGIALGARLARKPIQVAAHQPREALPLADSTR